MNEFYERNPLMGTLQPHSNGPLYSRAEKNLGFLEFF